MLLTRRSFSLLRKKYASILRHCRHLNFTALAIGLLVVSAHASTLDINAEGGSAEITNGGAFETLTITGSHSPTIDLKSRLTLIGTKSNQPLIRGATSAFVRVIDTTFSLGAATKANGGVLYGDISLGSTSTLRIYGSSNHLLPTTYTIGSAGASTARIEGSGSIAIRPGAILYSGPVGSEETPLGSIEIGDGGRMQMRDGIWATSVRMESASMCVLSGDIHIDSLNLTGTGASLQAGTGDIFLNNISSSSPDDELFAQAGIHADEGNVTITGDIDLVKGLTAITAGGDIIFEQGDSAISGPGELYLKAGGNVGLDSAHLENARLEALKMSIRGDLVAANALAAQLITGKAEIAEDLEIQGNSVNIFGTKVDYGILKITETGNKVGKNLKVFDAILDVPDMEIGQNAVFSAVKGSFDNLKIGDTLDFAAGDISGNELHAKSILMGEGEYATSLNVKNITFNDLKIGSGGTLQTDSISSPGGNISLQNGGALLLSEGDMGSSDEPLGDISLSGKSELAAPASIYATTLTGSTPGGDSVNAKGNIQIGGEISGTLNLVAEGDIKAKGIAANSLNAKNVEITAGTLHLYDTGEVANNLTITGPGTARAGEETGFFSTLHVGDTITISGSDITGTSLTAGTLLAASPETSTNVQIAKMSDGFGLGVGQNAWVTLGEPETGWLKNVTSTTRTATAALGIANPVKVGQTGLTVNPASTNPTPTRGQIDFAPESLLVIYGPNAREDANAAGMISAVSPMQAYVEEGAKLLLDGVVANQVYGVLGDNITTTYANANAWNEDHLETGSHIVGLRKIEGRNGWFTTYARDPAENYPGIDPGLKPPLIEGNGGSSTTPTTPPATDTPTTPTTPANPTPSNPAPTTPTTPTNPTPSNPAPTTPTTPTNPAPSNPSPTTPTTPTTPTNPTPSNPAPTTPTTPTNPTPSNPSPTTPTNPTPSNPAPTTPTTPTTPTNPAPSDPTTPTNPAPTNPEPANPTTPPSADTPSTPDTPASPDQPAEPTTPAEPENPPADEPTEPDQPGEPSEPATTPAEPVLGTGPDHFNSDYAGIRFLSRVTSTKYMDHKYDLAWKTIEAAARMAILGAVPQLTYAANMGAVDAAEGRATFADRAEALLQELNGNAFALWITPIYRNIQGYDLAAYNLGYDFSGGLGGVVFGADYTFAKNLRVGLDASMGGGYAASGGDLARTTNNMGFVGIGAYAGWLPGNFGLSGDVHFTSTWNSLKQEFPWELEMRDPTGELTARALSVGLRAEYRIPFESWQLIPHAGVRYANVHTDEYSIYSNGAMIDGDAIEQNIWTCPFGLEVRGKFTTESGWLLQPSLDFLVTPASGDIYATTKLHFTGVPGEANIDTQTMDYLRYGASLGIQAKKDNLNLGLDYKIQTGWRTTEQSIFGTFAWEF